MKTPVPGTRLRVIDHDALGMTPVVIVTKVFASLGEDWGDDGMTAAEMRDVLEQTGKTAEWFALVRDEDDDLITSCVASFEVELVE